MAVTFDELKLMVEEMGLNFLSDPDKETILLGFSGPHGIHHLLLKRLEDGEGILLRVPGLAMARDDHPFKAKVLETLLAENHKVKVGRFCYDPIDGEIYLDWFLPLEDGMLTPKQLQRCFVTLLHLADEVTPRLHHLLETGEDLPSKGMGILEFMRSLLQEGMLKGLLSEDAEIRLRRMLEQIEEGEEGESSE